MTNEKSQVVLRGVNGTSVLSAVQQCLERCEWQSWVPSGATVVLKPNVCTAVAKIVDVANTSVEVTAAACEVLRTRARKIYIVEANHMRETAWQAFEASGYVEMAKRLDVELVNLSEQPLAPVHCDPVGPIALWPPMLECDAFITLPVLKTHALTYFTGSLKNQWGCVPNYQDRIYHHTKINQLLPTLHRIFKPKLSLMDATTAMEGRGPVAGQRRKMDLILASRDGVALDSRDAGSEAGTRPHKARGNRNRWGLGTLRHEVRSGARGCRQPRHVLPRPLPLVREEHFGKRQALLPNREFREDAAQSQGSGRVVCHPLVDSCIRSRNRLLITTPRVDSPIALTRPP